MELFKLLGTIVIEKGEALRALREAQQEGEKTESKLGKVFSGIGKGAAVCGKAIMSGLAVGATAMAGLTMKALSASGELEQNLGGAEAVFGDVGVSIDKMSTKVITGYDKATGKAIYETRSLEKESKELKVLLKNSKGQKKLSLAKRVGIVDAFINCKRIRIGICSFIIIKSPIIIVEYLIS